MLRFFLILNLLPGFVTLHAQKLNGKIHLGLSETEGINKVRVEVDGFSTQFTDELGKFTLDLFGTARGTMVELDVYKEGFAVINREVLRPRIPDRDTERLHLYLCPKADRQSQALQYYKLQVTRTIDRNYQEEAKILADQMNYEAIAELTRKKETAEKMADSLAARLSRFDPAQSSNELTRAMQLYQEGKVDEALKMIDPEKIATRIKARKDAIQELQAAYQQDIETLMKAGDIALSNFQFQEAYTYYQTAVEADTTHFNNLWTLCFFLVHYQKSSDLLFPCARKMVSAALNEEERSIALNFLGLGLDRQNRHLEAIEAYSEAATIKKELVNQNPDYSISEVIIVLNNLANSYQKNRMNEEALKVHLEALALLKTPNAESDHSFTFDLASTLNGIGLTYEALNQIDEALEALKKSVDFYQKEIDRGNSQAEFDITIALINLGGTYNKTGKFSEALDVYTYAVELRKELFMQNPAHFETTLPLALNGQAMTFLMLERKSEALKTFQESLEISQKLALEYSPGFAPDVAFTYSGLGDTYRSLKQFPEALEAYLLSYEIIRPLVEDNPQKFEFELIQ